MRPRLENTYSSRSCAGDNLRGEWPTTLQSLARYSSANTITAPTLIAVNNPPKRASYSGTEARIIASTSRMTMATISRTKREPTEYGR